MTPSGRFRTGTIRGRAPRRARKGASVSRADATQADLDDLCRLEQESFHGHDAFSRAQFRYLLRSPTASIRVIRDGGRIVAAAILLRRGLSPFSSSVVTKKGTVPCARLYSMAVSPACRGRGLGKLLMVDLIRLCRRESVRRLFLEVRHVNVPAIELYKQFGFRVARQLPHYYGRGEHGLKMVLEP